VRYVCLSVYVCMCVCLCVGVHVCHIDIKYIGAEEEERAE